VPSLNRRTSIRVQVSQTARSSTMTAKLALSTPVSPAAWWPATACCQRTAPSAIATPISWVCAPASNATTATSPAATIATDAVAPDGIAARASCASAPSGL
jgi:hypothetical protein